MSSYINVGPSAFATWPMYEFWLKNMPFVSLLTSIQMYVLIAPKLLSISMGLAAMKTCIDDYLIQWQVPSTSCLFKAVQGSSATDTIFLDCLSQNRAKISNLTFKNAAFASLWTTRGTTCNYFRPAIVNNTLNSLFVLIKFFD